MDELPVPLALSRFVRSMRVFTNTEFGSHYRRIPDCESELLIHVDAQRTAATFFGTRTQALEKPVTRSGKAVIVRFRAAGAYAFFREPMSALTDRSSALEDLWDPDARGPLFEARGPAAAAQATTAALESALHSAAAREPASVPAARRAVRLVRDATVVPSVSDLAGELGLSERQLRRVFDTVVGLPPKRFLRIVRFRRALRAARASQRPDWASLAEQHGYFDQAHLIADFRALTGRTPSELTAAQRRGAGHVAAAPERK